MNRKKPSPTSTSWPSPFSPRPSEENSSPRTPTTNPPRNYWRGYSRKEPPKKKRAEHIPRGHGKV